jgi:hypothetical protein
MDKSDPKIILTTPLTRVQYKSLIYNVQDFFQTENVAATQKIFDRLNLDVNIENMAGLFDECDNNFEKRLKLLS